MTRFIYTTSALAHAMIKLSYVIPDNYLKRATDSVIRTLEVLHEREREWSDQPENCTTCQQPRVLNGEADCGIHS